jgi:hypothetical protein
VRARSIDRKELGGDAHRGLVVGGGALIKLGRRSSSSSGRRWTRGWGVKGGAHDRSEQKRGTGNRAAMTSDTLLKGVAG